jgi:hypothetical protein
LYFFPCGGATLEFLYERESKMGESKMSWLKGFLDAGNGIQEMI